MTSKRMYLTAMAATLALTIHGCASGNDAEVSEAAAHASLLDALHEFGQGHVGTTFATSLTDLPPNVRLSIEGRQPTVQPTTGAFLGDVVAVEPGRAILVEGDQQRTTDFLGSLPADVAMVGFTLRDVVVFHEPSPVFEYAGIDGVSWNDDLLLHQVDGAVLPVYMEDSSAARADFLPKMISHGGLRRAANAGPKTIELGPPPFSDRKN